MINNSYNSDREDYNLNQAQSSLRNKTWLRIEYISDSMLKIYPDSYEHSSNYFNLKTGFYDEVENLTEFTIDLTTNLINKLDPIGGILDGLSSTTDPRIANRFLMIFALGEETNDSAIPDGKADLITQQFNGFGCFHQPKSVVTAYSSGLKDDIPDLTLDNTQPYNSAFQFTEGARVLIWFNELNYNTAIIEEIYNKNAIRVRLENLYNFGTNLTGAVNFDIVQLNCFRPYVTQEKNTNYSNNYQLISCPSRFDNTLHLLPFEYDHGIISVNQTFTAAIASGTHLIPVYNYVSPTAITVQGIQYSIKYHEQNNFSIGTKYNIGQQSNDNYIYFTIPTKNKIFCTTLSNNDTLTYWISQYKEMLF